VNAEERLATASVEWTEKSRTTIVTSQRLVDQCSDSGCEIGLEATTTTDGVPWRGGRVLERQDEVLSSSRASSGITSSTTSSRSFSRSLRQRISLRSFRARSEQFIRRRVRPPSCLRRNCDSDDAYGPTRRRPDGMSAVNNWLAIPKTSFSRASADSEQRLSVVDVAVSSRTRESSRSDETTVPSSSVDTTSIWNDHCGSLDSSVSATFPALQSNCQVRTVSNQILW